MGTSGVLLTQVQRGSKFDRPKWGHQPVCTLIYDKYSASDDSEIENARCNRRRREHYPEKTGLVVSTKTAAQNSLCSAQHNRQKSAN